MMEAVRVGTVTQLASGIVGNVPRLGDLPQQPVPKSKPGRYLGGVRRKW